MTTLEPFTLQRSAEHPLGILPDPPEGELKGDDVMDLANLDAEPTEGLPVRPVLGGRYVFAAALLILGLVGLVVTAFAVHLLLGTAALSLAAIGGGLALAYDPPRESL